MLTEKLRIKIQSVLDSDLTTYRLSRELDYTGDNPIHNLRNGKTDIMNLPLSKALAFEKLYEEMTKMEREIKELIKKVENWEVKLQESDPDYYEREYTDAAADRLIIHRVENSDIEVFYAEREFLKELRNEVYEGAKDENDLYEAIEYINELDDQFNYNKVVGYREPGKAIEWL